MSDKKGFYHIVNFKPTAAAKNLFKLNKRQRNGVLTMGILGVYLAAGGIIGYIALNQNPSSRQAQASVNQEASLVPAIRLLEDKEDYKLGDNVDVFITLQNPSLVSPVTNIKLEMRSAGDSILWQKGFNGNVASNDIIFPGYSQEDNTITPNGNVFSIPDMAASERAEYLIRGTFTKQEAGLLHVDAKIDFTSNGKEQSVETYRVFTSVAGGEQDQSELSYSLNTSKDKVNIGEKLAVSVLRQGLVTDTTAKSGTVLVTNTLTGDLIAEKPCTFGDDNKCGVTLEDGLLNQAGSFSTIFKDADGNYSNIKNITIAGDTTFKASKKAEISAPLGIESTNGILPIYVKDIIDANSKLNGTETCVANLQTADKKTIARLEARVNITSKLCYFLVSANDDNSGKDIFFNVDGTTLSQKIALSKKIDNLVKITSPGSLNQLSPGMGFILQGNFDPIIEQVPATDSTPASTVEKPRNMTAKMTVWHVDSGSVKEYLDVRGSKILVQNSKLDLSIPDDFLNKEGNYKIKFNFEDNSSSDWIDVSYGTQGAGFVSSSATATNKDSLVAGNSFNFVVSGILDKKGDSISQTGQCNASIWANNATDLSNPIIAEGSLSGDQCVVTAPGKSVTKTGPAVVVFNGVKESVSLPQAVQFNIAPSLPSEYGNLNLAYSPAIQGFSNTLFIGPVADKYGNLATTTGLKIQVSQEDFTLMDADVSVKNGFAQVLLPASIIRSKEDLKVSLKNADGKEILAKSFKVNAPADQQKIVLPNFPTYLNGNDKLNVGVIGLSNMGQVAPDLTSDISCSLTVTKSAKQSLEFKAPYKAEDSSCKFEIDLNKYRDDSKLLLNLKVGDMSFSDITTITSGKASNLFRFFGSSILDPKEGLMIHLVSTPILDRYGKPVEGQMDITVNGKDSKINIVNGIATYNVLAKDLNESNYKTDKDGGRYLDLVIDAKASSDSISTQSNMQIYVDDQTVSNTVWEVNPTNSSNYAMADKLTLMEYKSGACQVYISSLTQPIKQLPSFFYQGKCLVEIKQPEGSYNLDFYQKGLLVYSQNLDIQPVEQKLIIAASDAGGYNLSVNTPSLSNLSAEITEQGRVYTYKPESSTGILNVNQSGLNPDNNYVLKVKYTDYTDAQRVWYITLDGKQLVGKK
ncbi:MAG: hypothetical protein OHK0017_11590 [Patescibacteria group bacterium]